MCEIKIEALEYLVQYGKSPAHANCQKPRKLFSLNLVKNYIDDMREIHGLENANTFIISISVQKEEN